MSLQPMFRFILARSERDADVRCAAAGATRTVQHRQDNAATRTHCKAGPVACGLGAYELQ